MRALWWLTLAVCGCIDTNSVMCSDGELCPSNTVCTPLTHITNAPNAELCATPDALAACADKQDNDLCGTGGACHDGVCLPIACGNGYVDPGEACDDHNNTGGDGCSADCLSTEVCGNGVRDGIMFEECDDGNLVNGDGCDSLCRAEDPQWKSIAINQITTRKQTAMAYDAAHDQLVMFGGLDATSGVTLADTWLWSGNSWTRAAPRTVPPARQGHAMVYDAARHVVVMFGGNNGSQLHTFSDTWEWDGHDWHVSVTTQVPQRRDGMAMVYDGKRHRVLLFGGHVKTFDNLDYYQNDLWAYDGVAWTQLTTTTTPEVRTQPAMAYDPLRDQVVMFGGMSSTLIALKTWNFDGTDWHANTPALQPTARYGARMAWDAPTHTIAMFGGFTTIDVSETWQWNGSAWSQTAGTAPAARDTFGFASDPARGRSTLFGGNADALTWQWNGGAWSNVTPYNATPNPNAIESSVDLRHGRTLVTFSGLTLASSGDGWSPATPTITTAPFQPASAYDVAHDQTVIFGGVDNNDLPLNQTWIGTTSAWTLATPATSPPVRMDMRLAYDAARSQTILFGGNADENGNTKLGDTWMWDGTTWHQLSPAHSPSPRSAPEMAYDWSRQRIVLFGGTGPSNVYMNDTWTWDGTDWSVQAPATVPSPRSNTGFTYDPRRRSLLMIDDPNTFVSDAWEWNGSDWARISAGAGPEARSNPTVFSTHDGALYYGGGQQAGIFNFTDFWHLEWENSSPTETCVVPLDLDGDGLAGCADPDCYYVCNPTCLPGTTCDATQPHCGDGVCDPLETCRMCPQDCGACSAVCGDAFCDPGETAASCPGDCH